MIKAAVAVVVFVGLLFFMVSDLQGAEQGTGEISVTATLTHGSSREIGRGGRVSNPAELSWRLTDRYGRRVGRMLMACRWVLARARLCQAEITLPLGKITATGSSVTPFDGDYAVTGGTGRYVGGGGVLSFQAIGVRKQVVSIEITT